MRGIIQLFFALFCFLHVTVARPQNEITNAARLQAGLPLLKPRALYSPSRVGARDPNPSVVPPPPPGIEVRGSNGNTMGYVTRSLNGFGFYGVTTSANADDRLGITAPSSTPADITITTGAAYPYLGFALSGNNKLSDGFFAYCSSTQHTNPGSPPSQVGSSRGSGSYSESSIWSLSGGQLIPTWVEPDGSTISVAIFYNTGADSLFITSAAFDTGFPRVTFWVV